MLPSPQILLADDNIVNQKVATTLLTRQHHSVTSVTNGQDALSALQTGTFDLVLMDVQMPQLRGLQAIARLREQEFQSGMHTPVIAVTAHTMQGDRERCLTAGMDGYLAKPFTTESLFHAIEHVMAPQKHIST